MLRYENGEHIIYIIKKPKRKEKTYLDKYCITYCNNYYNNTYRFTYSWVGIDNGNSDRDN